MENCKAVATPQEQNTVLIQNEGNPGNKQEYQALIESLTFAVTGTRPDIAQALGSVNQFSSNPSQAHWTAAKRVLRYIKGTVSFGIQLSGAKNDSARLEGYVDAEWGSNPDGRKSQSDYEYCLCGGLISWTSKKQPIEALSCTEAEYIAASFALQEALWLRSLVRNMTFKQEQPTVIPEDNQGAISLCSNPKFHSRAKHIDIRYHYIREKIESKEKVEVVQQRTDSRLFTKPLGKTTFQRFRDQMGILNSI